MDFLTLIAAFKNEKHALPEWISHYLALGVDQIFLVDNNSDDGWDKDNTLWLSTDNITSSNVNNRVTFLTDGRIHSQVLIYNDVFAQVRSKTKYVMVCDLDEFIYPRLGFGSFPDFLDAMESEAEFSTIKIPWKIFASSGHIDQPECGIRKGFTWRWSYNSPMQVFAKYICRADDAASLGVHCPVMKRGNTCRPNLAQTPLKTAKSKVPISEDILSSDCLHLNHYVIQSLEFFKAVKMTRGSINSSISDKARTLSYFHAHDRNEVKDNELVSILEAQGQ